MPPLQSACLALRRCFPHALQLARTVNKILTFLALFAFAFLAATMLLGLSLGDVANPDDAATQRWATVHRLSGVAAALSVVLVDSIVITYFVGTSRWCKEVVETYKLSPSLVVRSNRLKRATFPISTISMLVVVGIVALGGAADPAASLRPKPVAGITWATFHLLGALIGTALVGLGFLKQRANMEAHHEVVEEVMAEVRRIRQERGLPVEETV